MQLKKGAIVNVVLEISVLGDEWCRIALPNRPEPVGYTLCAELKHVASAGRPDSRAEPVILARKQEVSPTNVTTQTLASKSVALSNRDVLDMIASGLPEGVVVAKIKSSACEFDTTPKVLKELKASGLPDSVILVMVEAPSGQPKSTVVAEAPTATAVQTPDSRNTSSDGKIRVLVTDSQSWEMRGGSSAGGNSNGWGASSSFPGGARPQTAEIINVE
jgi:hypothetical protein